MISLTNLEITRILYYFRLTVEEKAGKKIPESSRIEFLKFPANNGALSDAEDNTSGRLYKGGIVDLLLLRTILAICQKKKSQLCFWEVILCCIDISKITRLHLIPCLSFTLDT